MLQPAQRQWTRLWASRPSTDGRRTASWVNPAFGLHAYQVFLGRSDVFPETEGFRRLTNTPEILEGWGF